MLWQDDSGCWWSEVAPFQMILVKEFVFKILKKKIVAKFWKKVINPWPSEVDIKVVSLVTRHITIPSESSVLRSPQRHPPLQRQYGQ